jgi:hypothetical protein
MRADSVANRNRLPKPYWLCVAIIYESAPRVNRSFVSCAAPAGAAVLELRYTTTEPAGDRATLESDLSAVPEAEMSWGV